MYCIPNLSADTGTGAKFRAAHGQVVARATWHAIKGGKDKVRPWSR